MFQFFFFPSLDCFLFVSLGFFFSKLFKVSFCMFSFPELELHLCDICYSYDYYKLEKITPVISSRNDYSNETAITVAANAYVA